MSFGRLTTSTFTSDMIPETGEGIGPTNFRLSRVPRLLPRFTLVPAGRIRADVNFPAIAESRLVIPTVASSLSSFVIHVLPSRSWRRLSGKLQCSSSNSYHSKGTELQFLIALYI